MGAGVERLAQYQLEGAQFLSQHPRAALLDEPGLGKTAQAIRARELVGAEKTLVICPAGVRQVWPYQIKEWGRSNPRIAKAETVYDMVAWMKGKVDILVISYEQAVKWCKDLASDFFDLLIVDESHYIKNPDSLRSISVIGGHFVTKGAKGLKEAFVGISNMASRTWLLTGTPLKNDPSDLWVVLHTTGATKLQFEAFKKKYFRQVYGTFSVKHTVRPGFERELKAMLDQVSVMRTFGDVGETLPPLRLDMLPIDGDNAAVIDYLRQYPGLSERVMEALHNNGTLSFEDQQHSSTIRALIAEAKAPGYARLITEELKAGLTDKLVVMGHHKKALGIVHSHLAANKIKAELVVGDTSETQREAIVRSFQDDPQGVRVIVGNIQAAGTGLTLTAACKLDMLESSWTPADNVQAIKRISRKGQTRPMFVRFPMLENSFDGRVAREVVRKANEFAKIIGRDNLSQAMVRH